MFRLIIGFLGGVMVSRNAEAMSAPSMYAVILAALAGWFLAYRFGKRDVNMAVATAVATATANAAAQADAKAAAIANSAVQIYMQSGQIPTPREMEIVAAYHDGEIANDDNHATRLGIDGQATAVHA